LETIGSTTELAQSGIHFSGEDQILYNGHTGFSSIYDRRGFDKFLYSTKKRTGGLFGANGSFKIKKMTDTDQIGMHIPIAKTSIANVHKKHKHHHASAKEQAETKSLISLLKKKTAERKKREKLAKLKAKQEKARKIAEAKAKRQRMVDKYKKQAANIRKNNDLTNKMLHKPSEVTKSKSKKLKSKKKKAKSDEDDLGLDDLSETKK
jgi:hypothetical protein